MTTFFDAVKEQTPVIFLVLAIMNILLVSFVLGGTYWGFDRFSSYIKKYGTIQSHYATYSELNRILKGLKVTIGFFGALVIVVLFAIAFGITVASATSRF